MLDRLDYLFIGTLALLGVGWALKRILTNEKLLESGVYYPSYGY